MSTPAPSQLTLRDTGSADHRVNRGDLTWFNPSGCGVACLSHEKKVSLIQDAEKRVVVVLGYYNGNRYLPEQIRSILDQSHQNLEIFISDDCSNSEVNTDGLGLTPDDVQRIHLGMRSSNVGPANNFLNALSSINGSFGYFAFSDQDDVWHHDKIADALAILTQYPDDRPALYCARTAITDAGCQADLGTSPRFDKQPSFANALVQSIGGGNTMVFNKAARDLIVASSTDVGVAVHDWWCYQIVSGAGGIVYYDPRPCLKYRQHSEALFGSNNDWAARFIRIRYLLAGRFRGWNDINLAALSKNRALLTPDNQRRLDDFIEARQSGLLKRLLLCKRAGIYRQTLPGNLGLLLGLVLNKV